MNEKLDKQDWSLACASQGACNLSGLAHTLRAKLPKLDANGQDDYSRLLVAQMCYLSHGGTGNTEKTPLDAALPTDFSELVNGLEKAVNAAWEKHRNIGSDAVNTDVEVKRWVRALCECCHKGPDPFAWRWEVAYNRATVRSGEHPYNAKEEITEERAAEMLASEDEKERKCLELEITDR